MAYVSVNWHAVDLQAQVNVANGRVEISAGDISFMAKPDEAAGLGRQIAIALEQLAEIELLNRRSGMVSGDIEPDSLPPITPPVALSDAEMAEGDLTEVRR